MTNYFAFSFMCALAFTVNAICLPDQNGVDLKKIFESMKSIQEQVQQLQEENLVLKVDLFKLQTILNLPLQERKADIKNKTVGRTKRNIGFLANATFGLCNQGLAGRDGRDGRDGQPGPPGKDGLTAEQLEGILERVLTANKPDGVLPAPAINGSGAVFTRWGRTVCPEFSQLIYEGVMAGSHHTHNGGGANYLCLPRDPDWGRTTAGFQSAGHLYGVEYEIPSNDPFSHENTREHILHNGDAVCAVCLATDRLSHMMIPGHQNCPALWKKEYSGFIMAEAYTHTGRTTYVCVDGAPEVDNGGVADQDGALLYNTEAACGSLPCPPYVQGWELTCAVCTK